VFGSPVVSEIDGFRVPRAGPSEDLRVALMLVMVELSWVLVLL
jgi:hypothetical protein